MSWGTCKSGSNNIHFDFPPIMDDGRNYASWQPGAKISDDIRKAQGITTNWQYRAYMQNNADAIIRHNQWRHVTSAVLVLQDMVSRMKKNPTHRSCTNHVLTKLSHLDMRIATLNRFT